MDRIYAIYQVFNDGQTGGVPLVLFTSSPTLAEIREQLNRYPNPPQHWIVDTIELVHN